MLSIYSQSTQYISVPITNDDGINPTSDVVSFAFLGPYNNQGQALEAVPTSSTRYYTGAWESTSAPYEAIILVGPSGGAALQLTAGTYLIVIKVSDTPEVPVLFSGLVVVS